MDTIQNAPKDVYNIHDNKIVNFEHTKIRFALKWGHDERVIDCAHPNIVDPEFMSDLNVLLYEYYMYRQLNEQS